MKYIPRLLDGPRRADGTYTSSRRRTSSSGRDRRRPFAKTCRHCLVHLDPTQILHFCRYLITVHKSEANLIVHCSYLPKMWACVGTAIGPYFLHFLRTFRTQSDIVCVQRVIASRLALPALQCQRRKTCNKWLLMECALRNVFGALTQNVWQRVFSHPHLAFIVCF